MSVVSKPSSKRGFRRIRCGRCRRVRFHEARGLCRSCYEVARRAGVLSCYPLSEVSMAVAGKKG